MQSLGPLLTSSKAPARPGDKPGQTAPDRPAVKLRPSFGDELRALATSFDAKAAILCCVAAAMYTLSHFEGSIDFFLRFLAPHVNLGRFGDMGGDLYWLLMSNVFFGLVPLGMLLWLREPLSDYGLGLGDRRAGFAVTGLFLAIMLPIIGIIAHTPSFHGTYPLNQNAAKDLPHFLVWELLYIGYFAGWEFFHRSFLLFGLRRRIGNLAVFVVAIPFMLEHYGKPEPEAWGSFVAAVALGFLAIRARSFWYGFFIHGGVAFFMDLLQSWSRLRHH